MKNTQPPGPPRNGGLESEKPRALFDPIGIDGDLEQTFNLLNRILWYEEWRKGAKQFALYPGKALGKASVILGVLNAGIYPLFGLGGMFVLDLGLSGVMLAAIVSSYSPICIDVHHGMQLEVSVRKDPRVMRYLTLQDLIKAHNRHIRTVNVYVDAVNRKIKKRKKKHEKRYEALVEDAKYVTNAIQNAQVDLAQRGPLGSVTPGEALADAEARLLAMQSHGAAIEGLFDVHDHINAIEDVADMGVETV